MDDSPKNILYIKILEYTEGSRNSWDTNELCLTPLHGVDWSHGEEIIKESTEHIRSPCQSIQIPLTYLVDVHLTSHNPNKTQTINLSIYRVALDDWAILVISHFHLSYFCPTFQYFKTLKFNVFPLVSFPHRNNMLRGS